MSKIKDYLSRSRKISPAQNEALVYCSTTNGGRRKVQIPKRSPCVLEVVHRERADQYHIEDESGLRSPKHLHTRSGDAWRPSNRSPSVKVCCRRSLMRG